TLLTAALPLGPAAPPDEPGALDVSDEPEGPDEGSARLAEAPDGAVWAVLAAPRTAAPAEALATACRRAHAAGATDAVLAVPDASGDGTDGAKGLDAAARSLGFADHHRCRFVRLVRTGRR